jgi:hypothetical protein
MNRILIQVTDEQLAALKQILAKDGQSVAWQVRKAIDEYLKKKQ